MSVKGFTEIIGTVKKNPKHGFQSLWETIKHSSYFYGPIQNEIGLSIGHRNMIAVEIDKTGEIPRMVSCSVLEIEEGQTPTAEMLKSLFPQSAFSHNDINTSVSGKSIIVRFIKFPKMNDKELRSALEFEAEKYIPFDLADVYLDFDVLRTDEHKRYVEVALVVAKREAIDSVIDLCGSAGLNTKIIDIDSFACFNTFLAAYPDDGNKNIALINIGAKISSLTIITNGQPSFCRDIYFGGDDITFGLSKKMGLEHKDAADLKCNLGQVKDENVRVVIREIVGYLINEIKLSFDYFESQSNKEKFTIDAIYLIGGSSRLQGLSQLFNDSLHIQTTLFDPLRAVVVDERVDAALVERYGPSLAVPIGLALR